MKLLVELPDLVVQKSLELVHRRNLESFRDREATKCSEPSFMGDCGQRSEDQNSNKRQVIKVLFRKLQLGTRISLAVVLWAMCVMLWYIFC